MQRYATQIKKATKNIEVKQKALTITEELLLREAKTLVNSKNTLLNKPSQTIFSTIKVLSKFKRSCLADIESGECPIEGIDFYVLSDDEAEFVAAICSMFKNLNKKFYLFKVNAVREDRKIHYTNLKHQNRFINFLNVGA